MDYLYSDETYLIRGAIYEVYKEIGCGFLEAVYQECLEREFRIQEIPFESQKQLDIEYKGKVLEKKYIPDFICYDKIIVEIKAGKELTNEHMAQVINYLKASNMKLGLLINFGSYPGVDIKRLIYNS
jgi:GxxExxY protein